MPVTVKSETASRSGFLNLKIPKSLCYAGILPKDMDSRDLKRCMRVCRTFCTLLVHVTLESRKILLNSCFENEGSMSATCQIYGLLKNSDLFYLKGEWF